MSINRNAKFYDAKTGGHVEVALEATLHREAHDKNLTVAQLLEQKYETDPKYGSVLEQMAASVGLITKPDQRFGLRTPMLSEVLGGSMEAGVISKESAPASRILFPAVILASIENQLAVDYATQPAIFDQMVALSETIAGSKYEQPVLDFTVPSAARVQTQTQGALPHTMGVLSVADVARRIPTFSLGLEVTDEALKATSLDFVTLSLRRQVQVERDARVTGFINAMISGDVDNGQAALSGAQVVNSSTLDATATTTMTQKAWVKWLFRYINKRRIDYVMCDIDMALKIEGRTGKPIVTNDDPNSPRLDALARPLNFGVDGVKMFIVPAGVVAADTVVGIDSRYAIRRVRNSEAQYQASEAFVMRRVSQLRFDFGETCQRYFDEAWDKMTIA